MKLKLIPILLATLVVFLSCKKAENTNSTATTSSNESTEASNTNSPSATGQNLQALEPPFPIADSTKIITTSSGLKYYIVQQGTGNKPRPGQKVSAMYHGLLTNGEKFDSSYDRRQPFEFTVGQGQVIKGWDEAFQLLNVGTKAILIIPPELGYGSQAMGNIPPNSTLVFHVELLNITG